MSFLCTNLGSVALVEPGGTMPTIDWTADQAEEVRQIILDRIEYLTESEVRAFRRNDTSDQRFIRQMLNDMRVILKILEAAYAVS
jgi:hypothetical protein